MLALLCSMSPSTYGTSMLQQVGRQFDEPTAPTHAGQRQTQVVSVSKHLGTAVGMPPRRRMAGLRPVQLRHAALPPDCNCPPAPRRACRPSNLRTPCLEGATIPQAVTQSARAPCAHRSQRRGGVRRMMFTSPRLSSRSGHNDDRVGPGASTGCFGDRPLRRPDDLADGWRQSFATGPDVHQPLQARKREDGHLLWADVDDHQLPRHALKSLVARDQDG